MWIADRNFKFNGWPLNTLLIVNLSCSQAFSNVQPIPSELRKVLDVG